jgi:four helix bundle protein
MAQSFRDLKVWNKAIDLTVLVYQFTVDFPKQEVYGLTSQMRRASVSVASNIAEGSARGTKRDFRQFVKLARGSNCELQTQLVISRRLRFGDEERCEAVENLSQEVGKMLSGLNEYLTDQIKLHSLTTENLQLRTDN